MNQATIPTNQPDDLGATQPNREPPGAEAIVADMDTPAKPPVLWMLIAIALVIAVIVLAR